MITQSRHADDEQLQLLLYGDEASSELVGISSHVETCGSCQTRLRTLTASDEEDDEVRQLLSGSDLLKRVSESRSSSTALNAIEQELTAREYLSPPSHPELLGRLGRYEIECEIGSGGMGVVFKGFDSELNRPVAIKVLARHLARCGAARQRFGRESRAAAAVVHEHVVAIHNVEADGETPFLVMQFVAGESLQARVDRDGPLSVPEILRIGIQTAGGLAAAHEQGIVHRDIKPANILLERGVERVLLTDFGLARTVDDASLTQTGIVAGTPHYMSPEQANGDATDHRTDLFSLGSVLYYIATGHPPFRAERAMGILHRICHDHQRPAWQVNSEIPDELSDIIERLLEKRPARRYSSATAVREDLMRILNNVQQPIPSLPLRIRSWRRRHPWWIESAVGAVLVLGVGLITARLFSSHTSDVQPPNVALDSSDREDQIRSEPKHGTPPMAPVTTSAKPAAPPPTELIAEVAPGEPANFASKLEQIKQKLDTLETVHRGVFSLPTPDNSQTEMQSILRQLDQLRTVTPETPRS